MPRFSAVSASAHRGKFWRRATTFEFVARDAVLPLSATEVAAAAVAMPFGFIRVNGKAHLVAVVGVEAGRNLFVSANGQWLGRHQPINLKTYPFRLLNTEEGQTVVCVDEDSGLLNNGPPGEPMFEIDGKPSAPMQEMVALLGQLEKERVATDAVCQVLDDAGLIRPWPFRLPTAAGWREVADLYQVDEEAFRKVDDETLLHLRRTGALSLAYCQMLSTQNLSIVLHLIQNQPAPAVSVAPPSMELDFSRFGG